MQQMQEAKQSRVNVAPTSDNGHYVEKAIKVVDLEASTESYFVEGPSDLVTLNHQTLRTDESCLINCQVVYDPFAQRYVNSAD